MDTFIDTFARIFPESMAYAVVSFLIVLTLTLMTVILFRIVSITLKHLPK